MINGPGRLAILAAVLAFGAVGATIGLTGLGVPFIVAALVAAVAAGLVQFAALRGQPEPDRSAEIALTASMESYRAATAALRHDLRGVMSPALMMSDRLLNHADPAVQRAGQAVVRSIERATTLLSAHRETLTAEPAPTPQQVP